MKTVLITWLGRSAAIEARTVLEVNAVLAAELDQHHPANPIQFDLAVNGFFAGRVESAGSAKSWLLEVN